MSKRSVKKTLKGPALFLLIGKVHTESHKDSQKMRKRQRNVCGVGGHLSAVMHSPTMGRAMPQPHGAGHGKEQRQRRTSYPPDTALNMGSFKRKEKATRFTPSPPAFRNAQ